MAFSDDNLAISSGITLLSGEVVSVGVDMAAAAAYIDTALGNVSGVKTTAFRDTKTAGEIGQANALDNILSAARDLYNAVADVEDALEQCKANQELIQTALENIDTRITALEP